VSGLLLRDPRDLDEFAAALRRALGDAGLAKSLGDAARARVIERYLPVRHLEQYAQLLNKLLTADADVVASASAS
jgi:glycosyltransferase involved in cell wall biosynthesis